MSDAIAHARLSVLALCEDLERAGVVAVDPQRFANVLLEKLKAADGIDEELLTLSAAATRCGYSADHLGALVRDGKLPNYGKKNAPRVKLSELPRKAGLTASPKRANLRVQIAREVAHSAARRGNAQA